MNTITYKNSFKIKGENKVQTRRCKFDQESNLPLCPLAYELCHSPCDLHLATSESGKSLSIVVATPDGLYRNGEII